VSNPRLAAELAAAVNDLIGAAEHHRWQQAFPVSDARGDRYLDREDYDRLAKLYYTAAGLAAAAALSALVPPWEEAGLYYHVQDWRGPYSQAFRPRGDPDEWLARLRGLKEAVDAMTGVSGGGESPTRKERRLRWKAESMLLVQEHPDWHDKEIAQAVGISPTTLSRCREYKLAAKMARCRAVPKGHVSREDGGRQLEAYDPEGDPAKMDWD
jgi:hypothetical protein